MEEMHASILVARNGLEYHRIEADRHPIAHHPWQAGKGEAILIDDELGDFALTLLFCFHYLFSVGLLA